MLAAINQEHIVQLTQPRTSEALALDYGVQSTFLSKLDVQQKLQIFDLTARASRELHRWAARYPLIRRVRVWPLSLSVAAAAPFAGLEALVTMAKMSLWIFTIDDLFDEEIVPFTELQRRVDCYKTILTGVGTEQRCKHDTLALALKDIRDDLKSHKLFFALHDRWAGAAIRTLDGMMHEHEWRAMYRLGRNDLSVPDYATYVQYATYSIGGPPVMWTGMITFGDQSVLHFLEKLQHLTETASLCLRLANDLRSRSKEVIEDNVNSVVIRQREAISKGYRKDESLARACEVVQQDIQSGLARCAELQSQTLTNTGHPERMIVDIARFVCDFYVHHDYHTFMTSTGRSA